MERLTEEQVQNNLEEMIMECEDAKGVVDAISFEEAGLLSGNKGLVISLANGQEFQITIVER